MSTKRKMLARPTMARATPARLTGLRSSMRSRCLASGSAGAIFSVSMLDLSEFGVGVFGIRRLVQRDIGQHLAVETMLIAVVMQRHFPVPPRPVHGIDVRIEKYLVEVPHSNRQGRNDSLIA